MDFCSLSQAIEYFAQMGPWLSMPILALSAMLEYVFPPFPGDTVTLAGAVLARVGDWSYLGVFLALTAGSVAGSLVAWWVGARGLPEERLNRWFGDSKGSGSGLHRVLEGYRKHGAPFLIINRFMPGIRAFFFVGAGMARIPAVWVAFYSTLSAGAWNLLLLVAGYYIGDNIEGLQRLVTTYMTVVWVLLGLAAAVGLIWWWKRRKRRSAN